MSSYLLTGAFNLLVVGLTLMICLRIAYGRQMPGGDPIYALVRTVGIVLCLYGWLGILTATGFVFGPFLFIASLVVAGMVWRQLRLARRRSHMALLAIAVEKNISLPVCVEAIAREATGRFAHDAMSFASDLRAGSSLTNAIARYRSVLPKLAELSVRIGAKCSSLPSAMRDEILSHNELEPVRRELASRTMYFVIAFAFAPMVLTFLFIKIIPSLLMVFNDFETNLPSLTTLVVTIFSQWYVTVGTFWAMVAGVILLALACCWYAGVPLPELPGIRWPVIRMDRAAIQRALAFPAEQQQPLEPMIGMLAEHYPSWSIRRRLYYAHDRIYRGEPWISSLRAESLLSRADVAVLKAAEKAGNLAWALREMAESNQRRLIYRLQALAQILSILMVLLLGAIVAMVCVAFFLPLVKLVHSLV